MERDPENEPAEMASLKLELSTLSTANSSLQSAMVLMQAQLADLQQVNQQLKEDNESYAILLREKIQSELMGREAGTTSTDDEAYDTDTDDVSMQSTPYGIEGETTKRRCTRPRIDRIGNEYAPWDCTLQGCGLCPRLAKLDTEISKTRDNLAELSKEHGELKGEINSYHRPLINRLPFELFSQIFVDVVQQYRSKTPWDMTGPLLLGGVCKMWRSVTLGIPRLWTAIRFKVKSCANPYMIETAKEWLSRSRSLPLSINIKFVYCSDKCAPSARASHFYSSIYLLRSHSARWSRIHLDSNFPYLLYRLLGDLKDSPVDLKHLDLEWCRPGSESFDAGKVLLPRSIAQSGGRANGLGLWDLPCGFERLTRMQMSNVPMDEVLYLIEKSPNLQECEASLDENAEYDIDESFMLPTTPIVAQHLTVLKTQFSPDSDFFSYLTLPSLHTLKHEYNCISSPDDFDALVACLKRSSPPLRNFNLSVIVSSPHVEDWYEKLPGVTSITVNIFDITLSAPPNTNRRITEDFLAALARRSEPMLFPKLRKLRLYTKEMSAASWTSLCEIFQNETELNAAGSESARRKLLKRIEIDVLEKSERDFAVEARAFKFFKRLRKDEGVKLMVYMLDGPKFGRSGTTTVPPVVDIVESK